MNVYEATQERLAFIFKEFDNIFVSFSGGKDSGLLLNLCVDYIRKNNLDRKIGVFHIDYEAQYGMTTEYVDQVLSENLDIIVPYRVCLPVRAHCATSMFQSYWVPWEKAKRDIWVRELPPGAIHEDNHPFDFFEAEMTDYELQVKFCSWYHREMKARRTCAMIGIRTQESLNRWRAVHSARNYHLYKSLPWTRKMDENVYNAYPVFDWKADDVWVAHGRFYWSYNQLYDRFYQAGVSVDRMRVASPFNDWATESLKLYRVIDPNNWGKMVGRVNGVNFTGIYGGTIAMGWRSVKLPKGHTWESYLYFLLSTLPDVTRESYLAKLRTSVKFWRERGGVLSDATIQALEAAGVKITVGDTTNYKTDKKPVTMDYIDDIDVDDFQYIPTYKRMCICIMKNDHLCKYMGFALTKNERERRKQVMEKYKDML
jgi:predicted phosphoadenosine phosphosulfate sulfurtransferase